MRYSYLVLFVLVCAESASAQIIITPAKRQPPKQKVVQKSTAVTRNNTARNKQKTSDDIWSVIYIGNNRIGYTRNTIQKTTRNGQSAWLMSEETHMTFKRFGQSLSIVTRLRAESATNGDLKSYHFEMQNSPTSKTTSTGKIQNGQITKTTYLAGEKKKTVHPWSKSIKSPRYEMLLLKKQPLKPRETIRFESFEPVLNKTSQVTITANKYDDLKLLDGKKYHLLRANMVMSLMPNTPTTIWIDKQGDILRAESDFAGKKMVTYRVKPEVALKAIAGGELDLAVSTLIRVNPIRNGHRSKKVVYTIKIPQTDVLSFFSTGATQSITKVNDDTIQLTVTEIDLSQKGTAKQPTDEYLKPSPFLQSRDAKVRQHATNAAGNRQVPKEVAMLMEKYVHQNIKAKNFSTALASAAQVAKTMEGDCTEHAVLLAAMLRAKKIPSRVVVGFVYIARQSVFGGHMWTEAYVDGHWIPLDATIGRGGIGAAHIKLAHSSFAENGPAPVTLFLPMMTLMSKMQITVKESE